MFDLARAMVVAIASAQAQAGVAERHTASIAPKMAQDFELPRFLNREGACAREQAARSAMEEMLELVHFAVLEGSPGLIAVLSIAALVFLMFAGSAPGLNMRNPMADAIATRFAAASAGDDAVDLEERLDFAPRFAIALTARQPVKVLKVQNPAHVMPFDALGAVILRGLPEGTTLSSGISVGADQWIVAPGDLTNLEMNVPELVAPSLIQADVVSREGIPLGTFVFKVSPLGLLNAKLEAAPIRTGALPSADRAEIRTASRSGKGKRPVQKPAAVRTSRRGSAAHSVLNAPNAVRLEATPLELPRLEPQTAAADTSRPARGLGGGAAASANPLEAEAARWGAR